jgi:hypothetical protein
MNAFFLLLITILALGTALVLAIRLVRLRLELWANRRALAILENVERKPARQGRSVPGQWILFALFVFLLWRLLA